MAHLGVKKLEDTRLFGHLRGLCPGASPLPGNVLQLCEAAAARLKVFPALHGQFTLHDEVHCLRVVDLMGALLGESLEVLNAPEISLLILAAYWHDQGMIVEPNEIEEIRGSEEWHLHDAEWGREHPNRSELLTRLRDPLLDDPQRERLSRMIDELRTAAFTDFVRKHHGERSAQWVRRTCEGDARAVINGRNIGNLLATICQSHVLPAAVLTDVDTYPLAELVGQEKVNVAFLALLLRLADILDFDRERTPDALYRAIAFTSNVSVTEWEKHRSIVGWEISASRIAFAAECVHPAYERAVRQFLAWIKEELRAAAEWARQLPMEAAEYRLDLPVLVDDSAVRPHSDPATGEAQYIYVDLEFGLSRDEIVKLLMTNELYQGHGLFVRELLQNSLDALRHRSALFAVEGLTPPVLGVEMRHYQDEAGYDVLTCTDNGVGMEQSTVVGFLTKAGRSYYRSPQFGVP